jgi:arsenate reductase
MTRNSSLAVEVLVFEGCPHAASTLDIVKRAVRRLAPHASVTRVEVDTPEHAAMIGFLGSPSVRVNGRDIEDCAGEGGLSCRTYDGVGTPPEWMVEAAIVRSLRPTGLLFLCVANSARSQIAEGIARSLASPSVRVWSAGSRPTDVRPEAVAVLHEVGIDISDHRSKDVSEIPAEDVDLVVTLCAEEECPVFLGQAPRLHWGLPDPAAVTGYHEDRLAAFRNVRDELQRRIAMLL